MKRRKLIRSGLRSQCIFASYSREFRVEMLFTNHVRKRTAPRHCVVKMAFFAIELSMEARYVEVAPHRANTGHVGGSADVRKVFEKTSC
jgi:hypothetical protein